MASLFDYLDWRGDLSFKEAPFNVADNLICSTLSYLPLDGIVPGPGDREAVPLDEAAELFARLLAVEGEAMDEKISGSKDNPRLFSALAASRRFRGLKLAGYVNHTDLSQEKQFAALTIMAPGFTYISYRGTDDTLVGWKEDFNMSFSLAVPSQLEAVLYLEKMAARLPRFFRAGTLFLGGHSKGGNLAIYAAASCKSGIQRRISVIYNNDGPGFTAEFIAGKGYGAVKERIQTFVPQSSVIGMLFEHDDYTVIKSSQTGIMQHNLYSWEICGGDLVRLDRVTRGSRFVDHAIREWIGSLAPGQRQFFIDSLFDILASTKAKSFTQLGSNWLKSATAMIQSLGSADEATREIMAKTVHALFAALRHNLSLLLQKEGRL